jgi:vacuolar-type H+-ATPase subunit B/Vma2
MIKREKSNFISQELEAIIAISKKVETCKMPDFSGSRLFRSGVALTASFL